MSMRTIYFHLVLTACLLRVGCSKGLWNEEKTDQLRDLEYGVENMFTVEERDTDSTDDITDYPRTAEESSQTTAAPSTVSSTASTPQPSTTTRPTTTTTATTSATTSAPTTEPPATPRTSGLQPLVRVVIGVVVAPVGLVIIFGLAYGLTKRKELKVLRAKHDKRLLLDPPVETLTP